MIILANSQGYLMLSDSTRYQGAYFFDNSSAWKTIEGVYTQEKIKETTHTLWSVQRQTEKNTENYFLHDKGIYYEGSSEATLVLDCKRIDDNREWGRTYEISHENKQLIITYTKINSSEEDNHNMDKEYKIYIAIHGNILEYLPLQQWKKHDYALDEKRKSQPYSRWVYEALKFKTTVAITYGLDKKETISSAKDLFENIEQYKKQQEQQTIKIIKPAKTTAEQCARKSLWSLSCQEGIRAGIPWFYEYWSRDELVSAKALLNIDTELARQILQKYNKFPIPNKPHGELKAADAPGWLFLRWKNIMKKQGLNGNETSMLRKKIPEYLSTLQFENGLVKTDKKETWMDSIDREGTRIEIQALTMAACKLLNQIGQKTELEQQIKEATRKQLWNGKHLLDGKDDETIRPNIFLTAYAYSELLTKEEWTTCFKTALKKLWLPWGGIATIDTNDKKFVQEHTGEEPASYHNGDSWYWINNITAIVLHKHGHFEEYVKKIFQASQKEITEMGAFGHHAELSSAKQQTSEGCPMQAWSAATFIELCEELRK